MVDQPTQRIVPGAPPPPPSTKSQKKKRKAKTKPEESDAPVSIPDSTAAALVEKAPEPDDVKQGSVAPDLVVNSPTTTSKELKSSPIVELCLLQVNLSQTRISSYATADPSTLNEDQIRTLTTLPALEAVAKELADVKSAIEAHESELAHELAAKEHEAASAEEKKVTEAVSAARRDDASRICELFSFLRLRSVIANEETNVATLNISQSEVDVISSIADALIGVDNEGKEELVNNFLSKDGEYQGVPYSRLLEISQIVFTPAPPAPVVEATEPEEPQEQQAPAPAPIAQPEVVVGTVPLSSSGSFHFMQASELESPSFDNAEWVERSEAAESAVNQTSTPVPETNGHINHTSVPEAPPTEGAPIDWAAEGEDELPSIDGLHATFGKSGSATPVVPDDAPMPEPIPVTNGAAADDTATTPTVDDDGFTQARGGRGRGRGFRGERGGFRGSFRGGDRGGFRGRGGHRGRGEWRGDSEHRGRGGRGRGRGGDRHGSPAHSTPA
ncbi:hypothetical protein K435DRAFT_961506 [Dendrothele bispora CBS 962.96]|uniref:Uncharacterized protein n=1 Tax=Dendrothele bispora (strain CBS 962.96) TaxID=1314807 RepID=A0A4S8MQF4_DENBC|nr:hypothetical protein K435DRAFT_961506 [Dendrothele bispora CBS 962.96]